jgi:prepilin-type processing-associated H-X9-DG protein/prepilin-type N-terminal cleavage/methylation domain-containing protein
MEAAAIKRVRAFTLVELIVVVSIIGLLMAILLPALGAARGRAKAVVCQNNLRNLGLAFACYAEDFDGYTMPTMASPVYWWGEKQADGIDHKAGFLWPYLRSKLEQDGVYECTQQRFGSYGLQSKPPAQPDSKKWITSTYGYNGYYLCSPMSGWAGDIQDSHPWLKMASIKSPDEVFAFADTLIDQDKTGRNPVLQNTALLDPPFRYTAAPANPWKKNDFPTTCFRHNNKTNVVFVDGHSDAIGLQGGWFTSPAAKIGSVGKENAPHYVPDWKTWPVPERRKK